MEIGGMYYNHSKEMSSVEKINNFLEAYFKKYKVEADTVHVNHEEYQENKKELDNMEVKIVSDDNIMKNYYLIGIEGTNFQFYSDLKYEKEEREKEERKLYG